MSAQLLQDEGIWFLPGVLVDKGFTLKYFSSPCFISMSLFAMQTEAGRMEAGTLLAGYAALEILNFIMGNRRKEKIHKVEPDSNVNNKDLSQDCMGHYVDCWNE